MATIRRAKSPETDLATFRFEEQTFFVESAQDGSTQDVSTIVDDPDNFRGNLNVHDVVYFNKLFSGLIGHYTDEKGFFTDRESLSERGVVILSDHVDDAKVVVGGIDKLAILLNEDNRRYKDIEFCREYLELARAGYGLLREHLPDFGMDLDGIPISLERAGLVTTRLAHGLDQDAVIPNEVRVVTKRAHPQVDEKSQQGQDQSELLVTVQWRNLFDVGRIAGQVVDITDFVNPASGASTNALLASARARGGTPNTVIHRSIMATEQGIAFTRRLLGSSAMGGMRSVFLTLGVSSNLSKKYYLEEPAVGDAGDVLEHFLPTWYKR